MIVIRIAAAITIMIQVNQSAILKSQVSVEGNGRQSSKIPTLLDHLFLIIGL